MSVAGALQGSVMPATSAGIGNSQTQQMPTAHVSQTDVGRLCTGPAPQLQLQQQTSQASDPNQPALQAATAAAPAAAQTPLPVVQKGMTPAHTAKANMPAGAAAFKEPAGQQRGPRWPGSCSQGAVADANRLHGVAAVVVRAQRSKSCSAGGRQHTAKKLVFHQVSLAQQSSLPGTSAQALRAAPATAAGSDAKTGAARQSAASEEAADAGAVAASKCQARQEVFDLSGGQTGAKLAEAAVTSGPQAASNARAGVPAAAAVSQQAGSVASVSQRHKHAGSDGLGPHTEADKGSTGSQDQWETAVSKLHSLAEKHSQGSQEGAAVDSARNISCEGPGPWQEHRAAPADEQTNTRKGGSATPGSHAPPVAGKPRHVQGLQQQVAMPVAWTVALSDAAGQPQAPIDNSSTGVQACQGELLGKAGQEGYTGLSRLRALMLQQKQKQKQQLGTDPLMDTGQNPSSSGTVAAGLKKVQNTAGAPQLGQQHPQQKTAGAPQREQQHPQRAASMERPHPLGEAFAEQGCKRKRLEAGACDQAAPLSAATALHMASAQAPCKRQCLPVSSTHSSHGPAAHGCNNAGRHSLVYGKRSADAAQPSSPTAPAKGGSASMHDRVPQVAWPRGCEPNLAPALQHDSQQLAPALPVASATGGKDSAAAAAANVENVVKAVVHETAAAAATEVLVGKAAGGVPPVGAAVGIPLVGEAAGEVPLVGQQDRSQGGSEAQQGGLRLDLSSEEDPLLCTQKLPSSQGTAPKCTIWS